MDMKNKLFFAAGVVFSTSVLATPEQSSGELKADERACPFCLTAEEAAAENNPVKVDTSTRTPVNPDFSIKVGKLIKAGANGVDPVHDVLYVGRVHKDSKDAEDKGRHLFFATPDSIVSGIPWGEGRKDLAIVNLERQVNIKGCKGEALLSENLMNLPLTGSVEECSYEWRRLEAVKKVMATAPHGEWNTDVMLSSGFDHQGAAATCREMGPNWFLPSAHEMVVFHRAFAAIEQQNKISFYPKGAFRFWTSNETEDVKEAYRWKYKRQDEKFTLDGYPKKGTGTVQARVICARH